MAVADFNADGRKDLLSVENGVIRLRLGETVSGASTGTFSSTIAYSSSYNALSLVVGDLTGDGRPDVVAFGTTTGAMVYRYVGAPAHFEAYSLSTTLVPTAGVIAEFGGGAPADLLLTFNTTVATASASVYAGNGAATGQPLLTAGNPAGLGISNIVGVRVGQFTADALPDIAVAAGNTAVYLIPGTGVLSAPFDTGTAQAVVLPSGDIFASARFVLADVTGSATPDLVIPAKGTLHGYYVYPLSGGPLVGTPFFVPTNGEVIGLDTGDVDGNGRVDLFVLSNDFSIYSSVAPGLNTPQVLVSNIDPSAGIAAIVATDAVGDSRADALVRAGVNVMVLPNIAGTFPGLEGLPMPNAEQVVTGDFNGDDRSDLAVVISGTDAGIQLVYANGTGGWDTGSALLNGAYGKPVVAKLNADNFDDLITLGGGVSAGNIRLTTSNRLEVFMSGAWGTVCDDGFSLVEATVACRQLGLGSALSFFTEGRGTGSIWLDDLNCLGTELTLDSCPHSSTHNCSHVEDVGVTCSGFGGMSGVSGLSVRFGSATGLGAPVELGQLGAREVVSVDLDNDSRNDLVLLTGRGIEWLRNTGSNSFAPAAVLSTVALGAAVLTTADINNDGRQDIGLQDSTGNQLRWWINTSTGLMLRRPATTGFAVTPPTFAVDVSDDGKVDVISVNGAYVGDGAGTFVSVGTPPVPMGPRVLVDFDNDSRLDLGGTAVTSPWLTLSRGVASSSLFSATAQNYWSGLPFVDVAQARLNGDASRDLVALIGRPGNRVLVSMPGVCR